MNRNHIRDSGTQYYFPDQIWKEGGRKLLGKSYRNDEVLELMDDLGSHESTYIDGLSLDPLQVTSTNETI
jgi:hypothetical protein